MYYKDCHIDVLKSSNGGWYCIVYFHMNNTTFQTGTYLEQKDALAAAKRRIDIR